MKFTNYLANMSAHTELLLELTSDQYGILAEWNLSEDCFDHWEQLEFNVFCDEYYANERAFNASLIQDKILERMVEGRSPYAVNPCTTCKDSAPHYDCSTHSELGDYHDPNFCEGCGYSNPCPEHCPTGWDDIPF